MSTHPSLNPDIHDPRAEGRAFFWAVEIEGEDRGLFTDPTPGDEPADTEEDAE